MRPILVNKRSELNRLVVHLTLGIIMGIIGGNMFLNQKHISLFFILGLIGISAIYYFNYHVKGFMVIATGFLLGYLLLVAHPFQREVKYFEPNKPVEIHGEISKIQNTSYGQYIFLKRVKVYDAEKSVVLQSVVQLYLQDTHKVSLYDQLEILGEVQSIEEPMNPSDFNEVTYLKTQNVAGKVKVNKIIALKPQMPWIEKLQNKLKEELDLLFKGKDQGIMRALLLGDDNVLDNHTDEIYTDSGISHVLCISGFHVGVITIFLLLAMGQLGMGYTARYIMVLIGIWLYAYLTGWGISTLRATWMMSFLIIGRLIWEEEDGWISLSMASLCILVNQPYQLFAVGFQLSFLAILAILVSQVLLEHLEEIGKLKFWHKWLLPWLPIQLIITVPLAYHFFQIPFMSSLLNFIVIPLFSFIMISGWVCLGLGILGWPVATLLATIISMLLRLISMVVQITLSLPLSTLCIGRPNRLEIGLYLMMTYLLLYGLGGYIKYRKSYQYAFLIGALLITCSKMLPQELTITFLYIGQGDGAVIITPKGQVIVIDGGKSGKGKVIERYLKYRGKNQIDLMVLSHSDEDHIGGLTELIDTSILVKQVCLSQTDTTEKLMTFKEKCKQKEIPLVAMARGDQILLDELKLTVLAPGTPIIQESVNDNSLVCTLQYKEFVALFTGDKSKDSESWIYNELNPVSIIKVSHHGSRTGTSKQLILKLQPAYAMISCGKNNLYGHPHREVVDLLEAYQIAYDQTNEAGAIWIETDGYQMTINKQREDLDNDTGMLFAIRGR